MLGQADLNRIIGKRPGERLAIAFSGGGDSTALVHLARNLNPSPLILIVDHALRPESAREARAAQSFAEDLGLETRLLTWEHDNPRTGLQEKARRARYGLMGQVCRELEIRFLLTGHTQDDQAETLFMRYEKSTGWRGAAGIAEYAYAPVWPELAEVTVVRPLLQVSRETLRSYNRRYDLLWTEDPSNKNEAFERIKTRQYLKNKPRMARHLLATAKNLRGGLEKERASLRRYPYEVDGSVIRFSGSIPKRLLQYFIMAASGTDNQASDRQLARLKSNMLEADFRSATLGGALCLRQNNNFLIGIDPGIVRGRHNKDAIGETKLAKGQTMIWTGRYRITALKDAVFWPETPSAMPIATDGEIDALPIVQQRLNGLLQNFV